MYHDSIAALIRFVVQKYTDVRNRTPRPCGSAIPGGPTPASRVSSALPMKAESPKLKQFLEAVLRGAAKIFGCGSTNLILYN